MTVSKLIESASSVLKNAGVENYCNEARWIFESVFECDNSFIVFNSQNIADDTKAEEFEFKIQKRASGVPVQYVIGSWDFYGETFFVGEGVLIPRPETELLVDFALEYLKSKEKPVVFDLCAGTGCIGLTVAKNRPDADVFLIEKSEDAFVYLQKNRKSLDCGNARLICGDIFSGYESFGLPKPDLILSNPPYIESADIEGLQAEVHYEPVMALDGGEDGFIFYEAIAEKWLPYCNAVAVECGEGQADSIKNTFNNLFAQVFSVKDFNGTERVVIGRKEK